MICSSPLFIITYDSYGKYGAFRQFGGLAPIEQSAQELATFAEDIMARMKVSQVDLVGKFVLEYNGIRRLDY